MKKIFFCILKINEERSRIRSYPHKNVTDPSLMTRGSTLGDFVTILTEGSMQDITVARLHSSRVYRVPSPPSIKCNYTAWESLWGQSNILCATLKRRGSWVISVYLWAVLTVTHVLDPDPALSERIQNLFFPLPQVPNQSRYGSTLIWKY